MMYRTLQFWEEVALRKVGDVRQDPKRSAVMLQRRVGALWHAFWSKSHGMRVSAQRLMAQARSSCGRRGVKWMLLELFSQECEPRMGDRRHGGTSFESSKSPKAS